MNLVVPVCSAVDPLVTAIQDGRREHGHVGGPIRHQQHDPLRAQLALLPPGLHLRLHHRALPVAHADDVPVEKTYSGAAVMLLTLGNTDTATH